MCLVDGNVRFPSLHRHFGVSAGTPEDSSSEPPDVRKRAQRVKGGNLWLLPASSFSTDQQTLLKPDGLQLRLSSLRLEFAYVLIDTPPANLYADAAVLGQMADGIVLVLEANATRREQARKAKETLQAANVRLLGAVLNKRTFPIPNALYTKL